MPTAPTADAAQQEVLKNLVTLAQTAANDTVNQIALVNRQLEDMDKASALFQERYTFWHNYISIYETEKRKLNGNYLTSPLPSIDRTLWPLSGNAYSDYVYTTTSILEAGQESPARISEFDGAGATSVDEDRETAWLTREAASRDVLCNGFSDGTITGTITLDFSITPTVLEVGFKAATGIGDVTVGGRVFISSGTDSCIAKVVAVEYTPPPTAGAEAYWDVTLEYLSTFTFIAGGASVVGSLVGFNNTERTTEVANVSYRQGLFDSLMTAYYGVISDWHNNLQSQYNAYNSVGEDAPDMAYEADHMQEMDVILDWINDPKFDDTSLAGLQARSIIRAMKIPDRITWINAKLAEKSYDERYNYVNLLVNKAIGSYQQWLRFKIQKESLQAQQPTLAQRAAAYQEEIY